MAKTLAISFGRLAAPKRGSVFALSGKGAVLGPAAAALDEVAGNGFKRAAKAVKFEGSARKVMQLLAPGASRHDSVVYVGLGEAGKMGGHDWLRLGGKMASRLPAAGDVTILLERPDGSAVSPDEAAAVAMGLTLRAYTFDKYKSSNDDNPDATQKIRIGVDSPAKAASAWQVQSAIADGVALARNLVNEPANKLGPVEFAERLQTLTELGVDVEVLDEKALARHKMGALLGVAQGSVRPPRVVVMRHRGGKAREKPIALVGKGVVFDTGGISMKPAAGMEDMKGDMGGAAAVAGAMHAVAARKAKANVVGIVGLVENMPDGNAQRPGDIVTSMSGKTIEILNTDAEGRLVLADILTFVQKSDKPAAIVDLATLTGAIIVALGHHHAGLFCNNDELADGLAAAGKATGEKVWRMPLGAEYDKMIDSKNADMKNIGGRWGGSITAAQFIKRFIDGDIPWAHLDVAGTAMGSPASDTNESWASGYGVRLLDSLIAAKYENGPAPAKSKE